MAQAGSDERLPWIEAPRRPARATPQRRGRRSAILVLLAFLLGGTIAVMAFLAGRGSAPTPTPLAPLPAPIARPQAPAEVPAVATPLPIAEPAPPPPAARAAPKPAAARLRHRGTAHPAKRQPAASPPRLRPVAPVAAPRPIIAPAAPARRLPSPPYVVPRLSSPWPRRPFTGPPGRVIQLGAYVTLAQADAAWWRLARAYPYLVTLPRMVTWVGPSKERPRYYRIRLAAASRREARALCTHLHRIGRGCMVIRSAK